MALSNLQIAEIKIQLLSEYPLLSNMQENEYFKMLDLAERTASGPEFWENSHMFLLFMLEAEGVK